MQCCPVFLSFNLGTLNFVWFLNLKHGFEVNLLGFAPTFYEILHVAGSMRI